MSQPCPTCGQTLDPLRAPVARIVGGRVVSYCSAGCMVGPGGAVARDAAGQAASTAPAALGPPRPAPGRPHVELETVLVDEAAPERAAAEGVPGGREADETPRPLATTPGPLGAVPLAAPESRPARRARLRWWLAGAVLGLVGALGGVLASGRRTPTGSQAVAVAPATAGSLAPPASGTALPPVPPPPLAPPPGPASVEPARLLEEARATLEAALADPSPRVRLLAATALARAGDAGALAVLTEGLAHDPSEIRRLEVASALARARDGRGTDYLVLALRSPRRDVRLEAARALALLGDARGKDRLAEALDVVQLRLGAAENLAALGDPKALAILKEALAGREAEPRLRAAVALGRAGDPAGKDLLLELVAEGRLEIGAEDALARLGDHAAVPALERALGLAAVRVQAAVDLRRLGVTPDLAVLDRALAGSDVFGKITAAEAALVLLLPAPSPASARAPEAR